MNELVVVIPVVDEDLFVRCIESVLKPNSAAEIKPEEIIVVDNTRTGMPAHFADKYGVRIVRDPQGHNLGVPRSWNIGAREVLNKKLDYLVIMSSSMEFGPLLHTTWRDRMNHFWGANVIEADGHSWHLIAFHRKVFEEVGLFDENFYPGYFEAIDFGYRMRLLGLEGGWPRPWINAISHGAGRSLERVKFSATPLLDYYAEKWGGPKGEEKYEKPFGDKDIRYFPEHTIEELMSKYKQEEGW